jgi:hypothetical protein
MRTLAPPGRARAQGRQGPKVIRRPVAVAIQISALLLSGCLGFAVAAAASPLEPELICRAAIGSLMDRDPRLFRLTRTDGDILFLGYVRPIDNFDWTYRCRIKGNRIIWASEPGRWRENQATSLMISMRILKNVQDPTLDASRGCQFRMGLTVSEPPGDETLGTRITGAGLSCYWVGVAAPVELVGNYSWFRTFLEPFPFIGFRQPVLHLFPGKSCLRSAHHFQSGKLAFRVHDTPRVASGSLARTPRCPTYDSVTRLETFASMFPSIAMRVTQLPTSREGGGEYNNPIGVFGFNSLDGRP